MSGSPTPRLFSAAVRTCLAICALLAVMAATGLALGPISAGQPGTKLAMGLIAIALAGLAAAAATTRRRHDHEFRLTHRRAEMKVSDLRNQIDRLQRQLDAPTDAPAPSVRNAAASAEVADSGADARREQLERLLRIKEGELALLQEESHRAAAMLLQGHGEADVLRTRLGAMLAEERQLICMREDHEKRLADLQVELAETTARLKEQQERLKQIESGPTHSPAMAPAAAPSAPAAWSGPPSPWAVHEQVFSIIDDGSTAPSLGHDVPPTPYVAPQPDDAQVAARRLEVAEEELRLTALRALNEEQQRALNESMLGTEAEAEQLQALVRLNVQRRRQIEGADQQLRAVEAAVQAAQARLGEVESACSARQADLDAIAAWQGEEQTRRARLAEFAAAEERHARELKTLGGERDSLWAAIDKLRAELNAIATRHDDAARECAALEIAVATARGESQTLDARCSELRREEQASTQRLAEITGRLTEAETLCCERERDLANLGDRLAEAHGENKRLERSCRELEGQRRALDAQLAERHRELAESKRQCEAAERRIAEATAELPELQIRRAALVAEIERRQAEEFGRRSEAPANETCEQAPATPNEIVLSAPPRETAEGRDDESLKVGEQKLKELNWLIEGRQQDLTDFEKRLADLRRVAAEQSERAKQAGELLERRRQEETELREKRREWERYVATMQEQAERAEAELDRLEPQLVSLELQLDERQRQLTETESQLQAKKGEWERLVERANRTAISRPPRPPAPADANSEERTTSVGTIRRGGASALAAEAKPAAESSADAAWQRAEDWGKFLDDATNPSLTPVERPADLWHQASQTGESSTPAPRDTTSAPPK